MVVVAECRHNEMHEEVASTLEEDHHSHHGEVNHNHEVVDNLEEEVENIDHKDHEVVVIEVDSDHKDHAWVEDHHNDNQQEVDIQRLLEGMVDLACQRLWEGHSIDQVLVYEHDLDEPVSRGS